MRLPGGVWTENGLRTDYTFRPIQGHVELVISECNSAAAATPLRVTRILAAALESLAGRPVDEEVVWGLAVGDRQFLMRRLAALLGKDEGWYHATCSGCEESFDFPLRQSELPIKPAATGFPLVEVTTSAGVHRLRTPTGRDQVELPTHLGEEDARRWLVGQCIEQGGGVEALTEDDLLRIEMAMEEVAPEVGILVELACLVCGQSNRVYVDPYGPILRMNEDIYVQIHMLAATYHWSQRDILDLPVSRRMVYLRLIDRARGMVA